jgi:Tfp pilus assembly protein FimT
VSGGRPRNFSLVALLMVIAACGILVGVSIPLFLTYHQSAQVTAGAQHLRTLLNQARQLAMDQKDFVCVQVPSPTQVSFYPNATCSSTPWTGPITHSPET